MKKFVATFTEKTTSGYTCGSRIKGVDASTKAVAEKRARKYAEEHLRHWDAVNILVEELTPAKLASLQAESEKLESQLDELRHIASALRDCIFISKNYRTI